MLVLVILDIFAQFLAAWRTNIEPHKLPEVLIQKFHVSHGGWHGEFGTSILFVVVDGCKMLHNNSFDSMSHFVQDTFQSTNSEDKFKHIQCMSKNTHTHTQRKKKTYPQHILQTHRTHIQNIKGKQNILKLFNF